MGQHLLNNRIRVTIPSILLSGKNIIPTKKEPYIFQHITENSSNNPDVFRILQWNIWHGGRHVPIQGHRRIIELIKATKADIVTMQEGYGFQEEIAKSLQYHLQTPSSQDNLALFSRYPLEKQKTGNTFCSNPAIVHLTKNRSLLVDDCWVRYSYNPDYTGSFPDNSHNPKVWIAEDSIRPMADTRRMLDEDLGLHEVNTAAELVQRSVDPEANIIFGTVTDPDMKDEIQITVIATGFEKPEAHAASAVDSFINKPWEKKTSSIPASDVNSSQGDLDIPAFLRKNKNKNM